MTNSTLDVGTGEIKLGHNAVQSNHGGHATADFENCVITAKQFAVYYDRPANAARFNNSTIVLSADNDYSIEAQADWAGEPGEEWTGRTPITVGSGGLTVDTQSFACSLQANLHGNGAVTKTGGGKLTVVRNQTSTADFICAEGEASVDAGLTVARPVTVKDGAALGFNFTERAVAPMLVVPSVTADGAVVVRISSKGVWRPDYGADRKYVLTTSSGSFAGANVSLADDVPTWVKGVSVVDGEIVLDIKQKGMSFLIR